MNTLIEPTKISTLAELQAFITAAIDELPHATTEDTVYLEQPLHLTLVRKTLTDDSKVYDIHAFIREEVA